MSKIRLTATLFLSVTSRTIRLLKFLNGIVTLSFPAGNENPNCACRGFVSAIIIAIDIARARKAKVVLVESCEQALDFLCQGKGADLVLVEVTYDIKALTKSMKSEKISTPVIAYGVQCSAKEAVNAIKAGAKE